MNKKTGEKMTRLDKIMKRGKLIAATDYNSISYFVYRGEPMGYQYEMLKLFAEYLDVKLDIVVENDLNETFGMLNQNEIDLVAMGLTVTKERGKDVDFTYPHTQTRQVLVQRKPDNWRDMKNWKEVEEAMIRNPIQLGGKTVHVQKNSSFISRLQNLSDEIGDTICVVEDPKKEVEELIKSVAEGEIDYTIADEHVALVNEKYYSNIDVNTPVSFPQNVAWAVKKGNDSLRIAINEWITEYKNTLLSRVIYNKYFKNPRSVNIAQSEYHSVKGGKISKYDEIIKRVSEKYGLDWRLLASLIYQESAFQPDVRSWVGAYGLMQLMPGTAATYGVDTSSSIEEQISAGVKFLMWLDEQLPEDIDEEERIKFILASYNAGIAHVFDARRLAEKFDKDPNVWDENVDYYLLNKSKPEFYRDSVVKYGYCRGEEPYNFVTEILERYEHYKNVLED
ncbi:MAG: transporter substrate-binding domain-containing protein [Bacteroidales bacterium]|nr:transporter substrate-binding domain-containing protein [Bacteroidales bacterium]MCF8344609.1 transporter substrate-binding domain-containing protein [Bacteroidales bacterium]MCF8351277.1 transporter substrate-binding domain-containing protein [Bacteroidales bacterium]MCF8377578.1 transporter substrate-binding domain-containing protein [Bacteroidales bacterium]